MMLRTREHIESDIKHYSNYIRLIKEGELVVTRSQYESYEKILRCVEKELVIKNILERIENVFGISEKEFLEYLENRNQLS